ncbi:hypothetical protein [uncultured Litoreibacter sp.]|uniref:hypothetical protein n=1 Tax=uncultured Litoreibacter sp. TaxID=1392394 RepID=UPI0026079DFB|nr:hypothetical protein [uncultured Litoreibacter sp.]
MSETMQHYVLADLTLADPAQKDALSAFPGFDQAAHIGGAPNLLALPVAPGDEASTHALVAKGLGIFVASHLSLKDLATRIGERLYYFHPATGRLGSYAICLPVIMSFFLLNAGPALAAHLTHDMSRIVARGYQDTIFSFSIQDQALQAKLMQPATENGLREELTLPDAVRAIPVKQIENSGWVVHACDIQNASDAKATYGTFPELTQDFVAAFELFQRRLCVRQLAQQEAQYLKLPFSVELEDQLLATARRCGYWDDLPFSSFAYSYLILGQQSMEDNPNFKCDPDTHPNRALFDIEGIRTMSADIRVRNLKKYGPDWDKEG